MIDGKNKINVVVDHENKLHVLYDENNCRLQIPESIAIILDGNGRYAKKHNIPRPLGHKAGCETLEIILEEAVKIGVKFLTVYAFSTENWKRSTDEINALFDLFFIYLDKVYKKAIDNNIKINFIGNIYEFPQKIYNECEKLMKDTENLNRMTFTIAFNYGGRDEILRTFKKIYKNNIDIEKISVNDISNNLDTYNIKDPDLLIRTSGEYRISNFLLWQLAYTELYFTNVLWPEFTIEEFYKSIVEFNKRERRFGGRTENNK